MGPCLSRKREPERTEAAMTQQILNEFLQALHRGLAGKHYAVIGAAALLKYGSCGQINQRETSNVDVLVTFDAMPFIFQTLSRRKEFRITADNPVKLGFMASDGRCYGLNFRIDSYIGLGRRGGFKDDVETVQLPGSQARIMNITWLLNLKAMHYWGRTIPRDRMRDSEDIFFILDYMRRNRVRVHRDQCPAVVNHEFWMDVTRANVGMESWLNDIGLQLDPPAGPSGLPRKNLGGQAVGASITRPTPRAGFARQSGGGSFGSDPRAVPKVGGQSS